LFSGRVFIVITVHENSFFKTLILKHLPRNNMNRDINYLTMGSCGYFWGQYRPAVLNLIISSELPEKLQRMSTEHTEG
jgi:hypothetical protein